MALDPVHPHAHGLTSHATRVTREWWALPAPPPAWQHLCAFHVLAFRLLPPRQSAPRDAALASWHPQCPRPSAALLAWLTHSLLQVHSPADAGLWHAHHGHPAPRHRAPLWQAGDGALRPKHVSEKCWLSSISTSAPISFISLSAQVGEGWINTELCICGANLAPPPANCSCCWVILGSSLLVALMLTAPPFVPPRKPQPEPKREKEAKKPTIKKPLNAFMLYMKEMRAKVIAECTLKESAAINQILGRRVRAHRAQCHHLVAHPCLLQLLLST